MWQTGRDNAIFKIKLRTTETLRTAPLCLLEARLEIWIASIILLLPVIQLFYLFFFFKRVALCNLGWLQTCNPATSASQVLESRRVPPCLDGST